MFEIVFDPRITAGLDTDVSGSSFRPIVQGQFISTNLQSWRDKVGDNVVTRMIDAYPIVKKFPEGMENFPDVGWVVYLGKGYGMMLCFQEKYLLTHTVAYHTHTQWPPALTNRAICYEAIKRRLIEKEEANNE